MRRAPKLRVEKRDTKCDTVDKKRWPVVTASDRQAVEARRPVTPRRLACRVMRASRCSITRSGCGSAARSQNRREFALRPLALEQEKRHELGARLDSSRRVRAGDDFRARLASLLGRMPLFAVRGSTPSMSVHSRTRTVRVCVHSTGRRRRSDSHHSPAVAAAIALCSPQLPRAASGAKAASQTLLRSSTQGEARKKEVA